MIDNKGDNSESTDLLTRLLIRQAFSMNEAVPPVAVKSGQQTHYIPSASIIYLQSNRHKTIIYCVDKELECSMLLPDIMPMLPDNFYFMIVYVIWAADDFFINIFKRKKLRDFLY